MTAGLHLEQFIESLENLPNVLHQNFRLMRNLDKKTQDVSQSIDRKSDDYLKSALHMRPERKDQQMSAIKKMFNITQKYSDDKVQLAIETYELVDEYIRRLDAGLAKFEAEIKDENNKKEEEPSIVKNRKKKIDEKAKSKKRGSDDEKDVTKKRKKKKTPEAESVISSILPVHSIARPSDSFDMPVDPNEPTYCICEKVSYGEMIACDNADCPIEWFHFVCVNLTVTPKGKWYCPRCSADRKKKLNC